MDQKYLTKRSSRELMNNAYANRTVIPSFNIPYLPMMAPICRALVDNNCFGFIAVALVEIKRFGSKSQEAVFEEYQRCCQTPWMRLHQDHVPVIDEDGHRVDYLHYLQNAAMIGYDSIMIDGSRLPLDENIVATKSAVSIGTQYSIPVEAELGAVMGHEAGPLPPYEELYQSRKGFTSVEEAVQLVQETRIDWLSVACGNIHGAIQGIEKHNKKVDARLNIEHLARLNNAVDIPLVLHGGSGIKKDYILSAIKNGISKINIGTDLRQVYENAKKNKPVEQARRDVYKKACSLIEEVLELKNSRDVINPL